MPDTLTAAMLDEIHEELKKYSIPLSYDAKGRLCYTLQFEGTKEEYQILKQRLEEI